MVTIPFEHGKYWSNYRSAATRCHTLWSKLDLESLRIKSWYLQDSSSPWVSKLIFHESKSFCLGKAQNNATQCMVVRRHVSHLSLEISVYYQRQSIAQWNNTEVCLEKE
jgi:hypothetical protein